MVFAEPERYAAWTNFVANYTPDYSDSTAHYGPPETGRIARPIRITENGKARAEIVVDYSAAIRIANFLTSTRKISFDMVVRTMYETGKDLSGRYRETSEGGLAKLYK